MPEGTDNTSSVSDKRDGTAAGRAGPTIDPRLAEWLAGNDTGLSSKAIAFWLSARVKHSGWGCHTPSDPSDLGRCVRLLERFPEWKARMGEMAEAGGHWPAFVLRWDEMVASFIAEAGGTIPSRDARDWSAPNTYKLMKQVEGRA